MAVGGGGFFGSGASSSTTRQSSVQTEQGQTGDNGSTAISSANIRTGKYGDISQVYNITDGGAIDASAQLAALALDDGADAVDNAFRFAGEAGVLAADASALAIRAVNTAYSDLDDVYSETGAYLETARQDSYILASGVNQLISDQAQSNADDLLETTNNALEFAAGTLVLGAQERANSQDFVNNALIGSQNLANKSIDQVSFNANNALAEVRNSNANAFSLVGGAVSTSYDAILNAFKAKDDSVNSTTESAFQFVGEAAQASLDSLSEAAKSQTEKTTEDIVKFAVAGVAVVGLAFFLPRFLK